MNFNVLRQTMDDIRGDIDRICLHYVITSRDRLYARISHITATKIFTIEEADPVTVYPTEFHVRMSRLFAENVAAS